MTTHPLPSDRFPLGVHFEVLRRFMSVSRNGAEPVAAVAVEGGDIASGAAQLNVAFLADAGFLIEEAPGRFKPTPVAMQLINTQAVDEERGRRLLRSLVAKLWFARAATALRRTNPSAGASEVRRRLIDEASARTAADRRSVGVLLQYLSYAGLVEPAAPGSRAPASPPPSGPTENPPGSPLPSARRARAAPQDPSGWKIVRTDDFELRVRPGRDAVRRLRRHLDLLEEDLEADPTG